MTDVAAQPPAPVASAYQQTIDAVVATLGTDASRGLSEVAAQSRLGQHGRNELATAPPTPGWPRFLAQFQNVLVILLLLATALSAGLWSPAPVRRRLRGDA